MRLILNSKKQSKTSDEVREGQVIDSVYDFFYHDGRRVASFLSQFDSSGSLTQVSQGIHAEKTRVDTQKLEGTGKIPALANGTIGSVDETRSRQQNDILRVYDPMWANARALLDFLDERKMIQRTISEESLGQIVLATGKLDIYDLKIMTSFWSLPTVRKLIENSIPKATQMPKAQQHTADGKRMKQLIEQRASEARFNLDFFLELAPSLPHSAHGTIQAHEASLWFNVDPAGLTMTTSDIMLKHGITVPGEWAVLGVLDAVPEPIEMRNRDQTPDGAEAVVKIFETLVPVARSMLGRPETSFGITPLLIFRETSVTN